MVIAHVLSDAVSEINDWREVIGDQWVHAIIAATGSAAPSSLALHSTRTKRTVTGFATLFPVKGLVADMTTNELPSILN